MIGLCVMACLAMSALASEYHGQVTFNGLPVPGATITAAQGNKQFVEVTNPQGIYSFPDLPDGEWTIKIGMTGFSPIKQQVTITPNTPAAKWELKLLPLDQIKAAIEQTAPPAVPVEQAKSQPGEAPKKPAPGAAAPEPEVNQLASNGFLINGSVNNGAASPFAQAAAFGNHRAGAKGLYNGGIGLILDNSALDAQPFSLTGQSTPKPSYNDMTGVAAIGGPLRIPHLLPNGPNIFAAYEWTHNRNSTIDSALMPDSAEREGIFSTPVLDPLTGTPFPGNAIPQNRISPQARALLSYYPLPNFDGGSRYNYQIPIVSPTHQDALQSRFNQRIGNKDQVYGGFALLSTRTDTPNLFEFLDTTDILGINTNVHWSHRINQGLFLNLGYQFSRFSTRATPYFDDRENVSANAGITGNDQSPTNWGPPSLTFSSGIAGLSDSLPEFNRNQTGAVSYSMLWSRGLHNFMFGGDFRRQEFNYLSQQDPRGSFTFTGAATGSDFAGFLLGVPDTSSIAFGNADKYFRESVYDAYFTDDWRITPEFTLNAGVRWEYGAPMTELYNRLVNLDIVPGFTAVAPVVASDPVGPLTGQQYPNSLLRPDESGFDPRLGIAWRPISGSSLVVRAGYGIYDNTSVYQTIDTQLAQQPPLSKTLSVQNSAADPLTLANGFQASPSITPNTFAIDPNFRVGYAQEWQVSLQRDLPGSLQMMVSYLGIKGTRGLQEFMPNTYPIGAANPCPACPAGYVYLASNGNSTREAGEIQLRRRLHSGFTATVTYTFSKSIDDDASLGGQGALLPSQSGQTGNGQGASGPGAGASNGSTEPSISVSNPTSTATPIIAQNWLDLSAERSLSSFDQRQLLSAQVQYTTGMGMAGGTLLSGWRGALLKEWTFATEITAGSGLPLTPVYLAAVPGTGVTGTIRPDYTGASLYAPPAGFDLNPAAYVAPLPGQWGNAGRNSITGPVQFTLNASMGRTFRVGDRFNLDLRVDSTNALNNVTYTAWNTTINNAQFGLPVAANAMRSLQTTLRLRF
jgi:hypothetical protein